MMKFKTAYRILAKFQRWRRGEGEFAWSDDPAKHKPMPYTPKKIGVAIDTAMEALLLLGADAKEGAGK